MASERARSFSGGRARLRSLAAACVLFGAFEQGCQSSGSAPSPCNETPFQCNAGETCWVKDCTCPPQLKTCTASACTQFDLACLPSKGLAVVGQTCDDSIGKATCGDGQWCLQEMNVNYGDGICSSFCDPATAGTCPADYSCVAVGVALVSGAPLVHLCQVTGSDASLPMVSLDGGGPPGADGGLDASRYHLLFDALPP
jgi:hypothetical protein